MSINFLTGKKRKGSACIKKRAELPGEILKSRKVPGILKEKELGEAAATRSHHHVGRKIAAN